VPPVGYGGSFKKEKRIVSDIQWEKEKKRRLELSITETKGGGVFFFREKNKGHAVRGEKGKPPRR